MLKQSFELPIEAQVKKLCVFCAASDSIPQKYRDLAKQCGEVIAKKNLELVYGGGRTGMMGDVSHACHSNGAQVTGIYPKTVSIIEPISKELDNQIMVESLFKRKEMMVSSSDAFLILPGGPGTLDEFFEVMTLKKLADHNKPIIVLNYEGFWNKIIDLLNEMQEQSFMPCTCDDLMKVFDTLDEVFAYIDVLNSTKNCAQ